MITFSRTQNHDHVNEESHNHVQTAVTAVATLVLNVYEQSEDPSNFTVYSKFRRYSKFKKTFDSWQTFHGSNKFVDIRQHSGEAR